MQSIGSRGRGADSTPFLPALAWVALGCLAAPGSPFSQQIKCWETSEGITECGQQVPPEYSQQGHRVIDPQSGQVEEKQRALTPEELEEARRQRVLEAQRLEEREEQMRLDAVLLDTYPREADLLEARDDRLETVSASVELARQQIEMLEQQAQEFENRQKEYQDRGKDPPPFLQKNLDALIRQIGNKREYVAQKNREYNDIKADFEQKLMRYRTLTDKTAGG